MATKTDNHDSRAKLELRRYFLHRYHADTPPDVLDCCQGGGLLWRRLREQFAVRSYWGVDLKPKKGRLKLDSVRILQQPGWTQNVVDIDTYGSPWRHWMAMLPNIRQPTTVFLTIGQYQMGTAKEIKEAVGVASLEVPPGILCKLHGISVSYVLARGCDYLTIREAVEAESVGNARYIGVRLEPANDNGRDGSPAESEPTIPEKEESHV
jgi:hypothetical protein